MAAQSLYRRYRPQRFAEVVGQQHVVSALRNAIASGSEGHAYLFSGPRGTGKTSMARILAKALNCPDIVDGEPCGVCESCRSIETGTSYDLFELDAASNNGVADMRDLVGRAAVGSPGRTKVYILDEVHMLSPGASNALLKTLEEPPDHVCFVLATTDPQKVLPTIRSRTQHYEFTLLTGEQLTEHVGRIVEDAGLSVDQAAVEHVVRLGRGSARDTLSALDQVVAAGGVVAQVEPISDLVAAIVERDQGRALTAVASATSQGRDPRVLAEGLLSALRDAFLSSVGGDLGHLSDGDRAEIVALASRVGTATITRALEALGSAIIEMRQSPDPRVPLEVALLRVCDPASDTSMAALLERIERLERLDRADRPERPPRPDRPDRPTPASADPPAERQAAATPPPPPPPRPRRRASRADGVVSAPEPPVAEAPATAGPSGALPTRDELALAMGDAVMAALKQGTKAIYSNGRFVTVLDGAAVYAFENAPTCAHAEKRRAEVEVALAAHFKRPVPLRIMVEADAVQLASAAPVAPSSAPAGREPPSVDLHTGASPPAGAPEAATEPAPAPAPEPATENEPATETETEHDIVDPRELVDATDVPTGGLARLTEAFPGAVVVQEDT